ncbi:uncharacterized protein LOC120341605 [Styela clava]
MFPIFISTRNYRIYICFLLFKLNYDLVTERILSNSPTMANQDLRKRSPTHSVRPHYTFVDYDYLVKIVIVGDSGVGKSQLVARFTRSEFSANSRQTIGVEFATKTINVEGRWICSQIWDTAGEERYRALASAYYRGAIGVLLVYDVTNPRSHDNLAHWLSEIKAYTLPSCQVVLIANKIDLKRARKVTIESGKAFAEKNDLRYIEVSALECTNVEAAFTSLIEDIYIKTILAKSGANLFPKNGITGTGTNSRKFHLEEQSNKEVWTSGCCK